MNPRIAIPENPLARFRLLYEALEKDRRWWRDSCRLRYAAMAAITTEGSPSSIASGIRNMERGLKEATPRFMDVGSHIRFVVGAILFQNGDSAEAFMKELARVRKMLREERLRRSLAMELVAVLLLRIQADGGPIKRQTVRRFREIFDEMKQHHRWLTGADDFPACAMLTGREGTPNHIAGKVEEIYAELRSRKFSRGNALQTAANILFLADEPPRVLADRAAAIRTVFREHRVRTNEGHYDEIAILSFLQSPAERIVTRVLANREEVEKIRPRFDRGTAFTVAVGLAFVELSGRGPKVVEMSHVKSLIDVQAVMAAQQAAVAGATAASAAN